MGLYFLDCVTCMHGVHKLLVELNLTGKMGQDCSISCRTILIYDISYVGTEMAIPYLHIVFEYLNVQ